MSFPTVIQTRDLLNRDSLNQVRLNKTQGLISDQIRGLRIDLEAQELSSVRVRKDSGWHGTDVGFALQRFLSDTNTEIVESPSGPSQSWADCSDALTFGQGISFDHSFASDRSVQYVLVKLCTYFLETNVNDTRSHPCTQSAPKTSGHS